MSPELEKEIISLAESARRAGSDAASFIAQQAPDVLDQLIKWQIASGLAQAAAGVGGLIVFGLIFIHSKKWVTKTKDVDCWMPAILLGILIVPFSCAAIWCGSLKALKANIAPKVIVMEALTDLAHGRKP